MIIQDEMIALIKAGVIPALGCTEPGAVALAAAYAGQALGEIPVRVEVSVDSNVYKNGMAVGVPGTGKVGLAIAAALGALISDPALELSVLSNITPDLLLEAGIMIADNRIEIVFETGKSQIPVDLVTVVGRGDRRTDMLRREKIEELREPGLHRETVLSDIIVEVFSPDPHDLVQRDGTFVIFVHHALESGHIRALQGLRELCRELAAYLAEAFDEALVGDLFGIEHESVHVENDCLRQSSALHGRVPVRIVCSSAGVSGVRSAISRPAPGAPHTASAASAPAAFAHSIS